MHGRGNAWDLVAIKVPDGKLEWVSPEGLTHVWDLIFPGVLNIHARSTEGWRPEDIYTAIRTGTSALHIALAPQYIGFIVTTLIAGYRDKSLNIWLCFNASEADIIEMFSEDVTKLARSAGAKRITFYSPRNWERRLKDYGFVPARTCYEKEL